MKVFINALIGTGWICFYSGILGFLGGGVLWGSMELGPLAGLLGFVICGGIPFFFGMRSMIRSIDKYQKEQRWRSSY